VGAVHIWYASYGSNLSRDRFMCYLQGGRPEGAARTFPGARDRSEPLDDVPFTMPGQMFFGWKSPTWGGGIAFYHADLEGATLARAYLISEEQFADVAAQEMHREPGSDLDLTTVLEEERHTLGPGRYEALHLVGELDGHPVLTFTTPEPHDVPHEAPSPAYLAIVASGLRDTHGLDADAVIDYLMDCGGIQPEWTRETISELVWAPRGLVPRSVRERALRGRDDHPRAGAGT
jgi:hypothetical protein